MPAIHGMLASWNDYSKSNKYAKTKSWVFICDISTANVLAQIVCVIFVNI